MAGSWLKNASAVITTQVKELNVAGLGRIRCSRSTTLDWARERATFAFLKKLHIIAVVSLFIVLIVPLAIRLNKRRQLQEQNSARSQIAQSESSRQRSGANRFRLPAPPFRHGTNVPTPAPDAKAAQLYAQFHVPKLSIEQAEKFLAENQRSAGSLVAAFRTSGDSRFLAEAMRKFPNDPQVIFEALFAGDLPPEERRKWADAFKQAAPDNPLANYLSAQAFFEAGQTDLAVGELEAAAGKAKFNDLTLERMQSNEEAYRANGFSEAESRSVAMFQLPLPLLNEMKSLAENMVKLSKSYRQAGDGASADAAVAAAVNLGEQFRNSGNALLVHQMLGIGIEQSALGTLDPNALFGPSGKTPADLLNDLKADRAALSALVRETVPFQDRMTPQDWISYIDRMKLLGEPNAMRWLRTKFGSN